MTIDLDNLERLAKAATPGTWERGKSDDQRFSIYVFPKKEYPTPAFYVVARTNTSLWEEQNAAYIAAANPATILALIERIRASEQINGGDNGA